MTRSEIAPEALLVEFCRAVVSRDFPSCEAMLSPRLRESLPAGGMKKVVRLAQGEALPPSEFDVIALTEDDPDYIVPDGISDDDLRGVFRLEFLTAEDLDTDGEVSFAFLVAIVAVDDDLVVDYLEPVS